MHSNQVATRIERLMEYFFFQAEDGIRDLTVTGVQTCALPISLSQPTCNIQILNYKISGTKKVVQKGVCRKKALYVIVRSEERRVGKSVDLGGRRIIKKKKKKKIVRRCNKTETYNDKKKTGE